MLLGKSYTKKQYAPDKENQNNFCILDEKKQKKGNKHF